MDNLGGLIENGRRSATQKQMRITDLPVCYCCLSVIQRGLLLFARLITFFGGSLTNALVPVPVVPVPVVPVPLDKVTKQATNKISVEERR